MNFIFAILFMTSSFGAVEDSPILFSALPRVDRAEGRARCEKICQRCIHQGVEAEKCYVGFVFNICCDGNDGHTTGSSCECIEGRR